MDEEKLALPKPHNNAHICICHKGVLGSCTAKPNPIKGMSKVAVEKAVQRRPPKIGTTNEYTMRKVAPDKAGKPARVNNSSLLYLKPTLGK